MSFTAPLCAPEVLCRLWNHISEQFQAKPTSLARDSVREQSPSYVVHGKTLPRLEATYSHVKEHHRIVRVRVTVRLCHQRVRRWTRSVLWRTKKWW